MSHPERKSMSHVVPCWVRDDAIFFITVCCEPKGVDQLCHPPIAEAVFDSVAHYNLQASWHMRLCLLMPDHLHALVSFPFEASPQRVLSSWKGYLAKQCGIRWQRDFFEHRLRSDESYRDKAAYIRDNPVRRELCSAPDLWPYVWSETEGPPHL